MTIVVIIGHGKASENVVTKELKPFPVGVPNLGLTNWLVSEIAFRLLAWPERELVMRLLKRV